MLSLQFVWSAVSLTCALKVNLDVSPLHNIFKNLWMKAMAKCFEAPNAYLLFNPYYYGNKVWIATLKF